jgi:SAM-dependent methyltransferase
MTETYKKYSQYYDMFYIDKNYKGETAFILRHLKKFSRKSSRLLSLGCGTCTYELLMAKKGYKIVGIDMSAGMLKVAAEKIKKSRLQSKISLYQKDVRDFAFEEKFDSASSMFNVIGYQTKNEEFEAMLKNVNGVLKPGGIFMFDCWYGPAVLKDKPGDRVKEIKIGKRRIIRLTKSKLNEEDGVIEINFKVLELEGKKLLFETEETHFVRFWSIPELTYFLDKAGFSIVEICNFMDEKTKISDNNWNIFVVARKRS